MESTASTEKGKTSREDSFDVEGRHNISSSERKSCEPTLYMEIETHRPSRKTHALVVPHIADGDFDTGMVGTIGWHMLPSAA
jgi:hypothetical protein